MSSSTGSRPAMTAPSDCSARARRSRATERRLLASSAFIRFFFEADDGIRYYRVTGVQTCALPISLSLRSCPAPADDRNTLSCARRPACAADRKGVVEGKRGDLGGRRVLKKKKINLDRARRHQACGFGGGIERRRSAWTR